MSKAFVDTTILTDILLNTGQIQAQAKAALARYTESELPVYAIKELKAGPLKNFIWMHNKLASFGSYSQALQALQRMSMSPRRYTTATAIQALQNAASSVGNQVTPQLTEKYGPLAVLDSILCDEYRLAIKRKIFKAWQERRSVTTRVVHPLPCYDEIAPAERRGLIEMGRLACRKDEDCCLAILLVQKPDDLKKLRSSVAAQPQKPENVNRGKALRQLIRKPKDRLDDKKCRHLGDAVFAFLAPSDAVILTTNLQDHGPLASVLGKQADTP